MVQCPFTASISRIAAWGGSLSQAFHDFESRLSPAYHATNFISKDLSVYAEDLTKLSQNLICEHMVHSEEASELAWQVYHQSEEVFDKLQTGLPDPTAKECWIFPDSRPWKLRNRLLSCQLDSLKTTVSLLANVLCAGRMIQSYQ